MPVIRNGARVNVSRNLEHQITASFNGLSRGLGISTNPQFSNLKLLHNHPHLGLSYAIIPRGEEVLIDRLTKAPGVMAATFRKARRDLVRQVVIPEIKKFVPRSRRKFRRWGHLRATTRVVSSTLERVVVVTGREKVWWAAIVHARWLPYYPSALNVIEPKFFDEYNKLLKRFVVWLARTSFTRVEGTKNKFAPKIPF